MTAPTWCMSHKMGPGMNWAVLFWYPFARKYWDNISGMNGVCSPVLVSTLCRKFQVEQLQHVRIGFKTPRSGQLSFILPHENMTSEHCTSSHQSSDSKQSGHVWWIHIQIPVAIGIEVGIFSFQSIPGRKLRNRNCGSMKEGWTTCHQLAVFS